MHVRGRDVTDVDYGTVGTYDQSSGSSAATLVKLVQLLVRMFILLVHIELIVQLVGKAHRTDVITPHIWCNDVTLRATAVATFMIDAQRHGAACVSG